MSGISGFDTPRPLPAGPARLTIGGTSGGVRARGERPTANNPPRCRSSRHRASRRTTCPACACAPPAGPHPDRSTHDPRTRRPPPAAAPSSTIPSGSSRTSPPCACRTGSRTRTSSRRGWSPGTTTSCAALHDPVTFSSEVTVGRVPSPWRERFEGRVPDRGTLIGVDQPDHDRLRSAVNTLLHAAPARPVRALDPGAGAPAGRRLRRRRRRRPQDLVRAAAAADRHQPPRRHRSGRGPTGSVPPSASSSGPATSTTRARRTRRRSCSSTCTTTCSS